jgi:hypothetical protein
MLLISELIKELQDVLEEHGDVNIKIINDEGEAVEIEDIGYYEDTHPVNKENYLYFSS